MNHCTSKMIINTPAEKISEKSPYSQKHIRICKMKSLKHKKKLNNGSNLSKKILLVNKRSKLFPNSQNTSKSKKKNLFSNSKKFYNKLKKIHLNESNKIEKLDSKILKKQYNEKNSKIKFINQYKNNHDEYNFELSSAKRNNGNLTDSISSKKSLYFTRNSSIKNKSLNHISIKKIRSFSRNSLPSPKSSMNKQQKMLKNRLLEKKLISNLHNKKFLGNKEQLKTNLFLKSNVLSSPIRKMIFNTRNSPNNAKNSSKPHKLFLSKEFDTKSSFNRLSSPIKITHEKSFSSKFITLKSESESEPLAKLSLEFKNFIFSSKIFTGCKIMESFLKTKSFPKVFRAFLDINCFINKKKTLIKGTKNQISFKKQINNLIESFSKKKISQSRDIF